MNTEDAVLARIVRWEAGLIVAQLQRRLGNFDIAEEAVQEAIVIALRTWRRDGYRPSWRLAVSGGSAPSHRPAAGAPARFRWPMSGTPIPHLGWGPGIVLATSGCRCCSAAAIQH